MALAEGHHDQFAAWQVEDRREFQILLCDYRGRTRSWLMVRPSGAGAASHTKIFFGSAIIPTDTMQSGSPSLGSGFKRLLGFHKLYSRILLAATRRRLLANNR